MAGRVVTWSHFDVLQNYRSSQFIDRSCNGQELVGNVRSNVTEFPAASACFTGLTPPPGARMTSLLCLHYLLETAQAWTAEAISPIPAHAAALKNNTHLVDNLYNAECAITFLKYLLEEILVNKCLLKMGSCVGVKDIPNGWEALPDLPREWSMKVRTVLMRLQKPERVEDVLCSKV